ncbi:MAG: magnesium and cobalt transport protein CorA [Thermodesulfobacteriota bacterium]|nr:MAG: magnesium and cobalt transport protein CorA [Thermodesulfobacteriota bacterium]
MTSRLVKKTSIKKGLRPGSLIYIGEQKVDKVRIRVIDYDETNLSEHEFENIEETFHFKDKPSVSWINIDGLHDIEVLRKLGAHFGIHNLVLEDILDTNKRPTIEDYGDYIYTTLKMLYYDEERNIIMEEQFSLVIFNQTVISFQESLGDTFEPVRKRIRNGKGRARKAGSDYLAYILIDAVIDNYFVVLEILGETIEGLEDELINDVSNETLKNIHTLKREMVLLRKFIWPVRELINEFDRTESPLIDKDTSIYLRDLYGHIVQLIDTMEAYRDMVSGMLDTYLSISGNKMNEVMKTLTIMASIFIPLTFIAGLYGMNFENMPELHKSWGYPVVILVMFIVALGLVYYFRKKKWF